MTALNRERAGHGHRRPIRQGDRRCHRPARLDRRAPARSSTPHGARAVTFTGRLAHHRQRGVADARAGRRHRRERSPGHLRPAAHRSGVTAPVPADHRGPGTLRARPVDRHARSTVASRPRAGHGAAQPPVVDVELPRPAGAAAARRTTAGQMAVPRRGADRGRRGDGRTRPSCPGRGALGRPSRGRAPHVSAAARSARPARRRGHRCRPRRQRHGPRPTGRRTRVAPGRGVPPATPRTTPPASP